MYDVRGTTTRQIYNTLFDTYKRLLSTQRCTLGATECDVIVLGALSISLEQMGFRIDLSARTVAYHLENSCSLRGLINAVRCLASTFVFQKVQQMHFFVHSAHKECSKLKALLEEVDRIWEGVKNMPDMLEDHHKEHLKGRAEKMAMI